MCRPESIQSSFLYELGRAVPKASIVTSDVGQHQMWVAQHYTMHHPQQHLSSGGLGTMGFGLPAAIGAQLACPATVSWSMFQEMAAS